jgi:hypothetical protein
MTTVPLVNDDLTNIMPGLRDFETLWGLIEKIKTSVVELKIVANFRGWNNTFPRNLS